MARSPRTPRSVRALALIGALVLASAGFTASARAGEASRILEDCARDQVPYGFSQAAYAKARSELNTYEREYSPCEELIQQGELARPGGAGGSRSAAGPGGGPGAGPGAGAGSGPAGAGGAGAVAPPTPAEQRTLERARSEGAAPVRVGPDIQRPGVTHVDIASALHALPAPVLALLALLAAAAIALGAGALRRLNRGPGVLAAARAAVRREGA
jgi:hypothetical protein